MNILTDFGYGARTLVKAPGFTAAAVVTIALGIGASAAIFTVAKAVLIQPLPYKDPERLVIASRDDLNRDVKDFPISTPDFLDLRNGSQSVFEELAAVEASSFHFVLLDADGKPEQIRSTQVTANFFEVLGVKIAVGRDFDAEDSAQAQTAILSYEYWLRRYGGDRSVAGKTILNGRVNVVGVLAPGFELLLPPDLNVERAPDIWFLEPLRYDNAQRNSAHLRLIGRLRPGVTMARAQAGADVVSAQMRRLFAMKQNSGTRYRIVGMQKHFTAAARPATLALMGAVIFLLLIACSNVANLLLVRVSVREREFAVRAALGGSRWSLVSQTLAEALILSGMGALLGFGLAWAGARGLLAIAPANAPRLDAVRIDFGVLAFAALAALAAAALFGLPPALYASRPNVMRVLRASSRVGGLAGGGILRDTVVVAEVALCFVLLIGSGLMLRSFAALRDVDPGYDPRHVLAFTLLGTPPNPRLPAFLHELQARLRALPGVQSATAARVMPLHGVFYGIRWGRPEGGVDPNNLPTAADYQMVLPGYFETLGARVIEGRTFTEDDNVPGRNTLIIDDLLAAKAFPRQAAVGQHLLVTNFGPGVTLMEVIGVVAHEREGSLAEPGKEQLYFTNGFVGHWQLEDWAVRVTGNPTAYVSGVRAEIAKMGGNLLVTDAVPMETLVDRAEASTRFALLLIGAFAAIAALLAGAGLYGVLSTRVRQRTAEIGVRMALGAAPANVFRHMVGHGLELSAMGLGIGLIAAFGLTRFLASMLVGVKAADPLTFAVMAAVFLAIAAAASWIPARRAAALDPATALREE